MKSVAKVILALFAIVVTIGCWSSVAAVTMQAVDTEVRNELAIQQMENTDYSSALYEGYRNLSNERSTRIACSVVVTVCTGVFLIFLFRPTKSSEDEELSE